MQRITSPEVANGAPWEGEYRLEHLLKVWLFDKYVSRRNTHHVGGQANAKISFYSFKLFIFVSWDGDSHFEKGYKDTRVQTYKREGANLRFRGNPF